MHLWSYYRKPCRVEKCMYRQWETYKGGAIRQKHKTNNTNCKQIVCILLHKMSSNSHISTREQETKLITKYKIVASLSPNKFNLVEPSVVYLEQNIYTKFNMLTSRIRMALPMLRRRSFIEIKSTQKSNIYLTNSGCFKPRV